MLEEPKPITTRMIATSRKRLIQGTKIWPAVSSEVCLICMRGAKPSCTAWRVTENAPEITACDAMTAAAVARPIIGYSAQSGASR